MKKAITLFIATLLFLAGSGATANASEGDAGPVIARTLETAAIADPNFGTQVPVDAAVSPATIGTSVSDGLVVRTQRGDGSSVEISPKNDVFGHQTSEPSVSYSETSSGETFVATTDGANGRIIANSPDFETARKVAYNTNLEVDDYLVMLPDGSYNVLNKDGHYVVTLSKPWAMDASGASIDTRFELAGGVLSQVQTIEKSTVYPVVSDPSWGYTIDIDTNLTFFLGLPITFKSTRSGSYVTSLLKSCFNCYFPISGAPSTYPYLGQTMNLVINVQNLVYLPAPVKVDSVFNYGWRFLALPGHADGAGSTISFTWYRDASGYLHLSVSGYIVNSNPCGPLFTQAACQVAYLSMAQDSWQTLYNNVTK